MHKFKEKNPTLYHLPHSQTKLLKTQVLCYSIFRSWLSSAVECSSHLNYTEVYAEVHWTVLLRK